MKKEQFLIFLLLMLNQKTNDTQILHARNNAFLSIALSTMDSCFFVNKENIMIMRNKS